MPPLVALAGAVGSAAVVRWAYRTVLRVNRELEEVRSRRLAESNSENDLPTLRQDPVSGAYRPS